jgi:hypothetical protein
MSKGRPIVQWFGSDSAGTLSGQMARHRAALQTAEYLRELPAIRAAEASEARRRADEQAAAAEAERVAAEAGAAMPDTQR